MKVYALTGVPPEVQAYAMAKYSRSAQSMRESIGELSDQRAEQFLNTFYFQYGHRSIADLAHIALAVEEISILAAIRVVDEPLWDGQERSTRYQDFRKSGYVVPPEVAGSAHEPGFTASVDALFAAYQRLTRRLTDLLAEYYPAPSEADPPAHRRTLRARAFDVTRALLPLATRTSVGQITSARVLERQIARLRADPLAEVRAIGDAIRDACRTPAHDLSRERIAALLNGHVEGSPELADALAPPAPAPTLVKYADAATYAPETRAALASIAAALLDGVAPDQSAAVSLAPPAPPEVEAVTSLLYTADAGGRSYTQVQEAVASLAAAERAEVLDEAFRRRGPHDEWLRELHAGYPIVADFLIDIGSFRDLHRHRRCVQLIQPLSPAAGPVAAAAWLDAGLGRARADAAAADVAVDLDAALTAAGDAAAALHGALPDASAYLLPLGHRIRAAFKMDLAQAAYICELRTKPGGHFAYRQIAFDLYRAVAARLPSLARHIAATDPAAEDTMLVR